MGIQNPNSTSYVHPDEPNLLNLHKAMGYNTAGEPVLRADLGSDTITITGSVNVGTTVEISNDHGNPIPTHAHLFDENDVEYSAANPLTIDGTVTVNQPIAVTDNGGSLTVDGSVSATVSGTVSVDNFPATQTVDGTVNIGTMPNVTVNQPVAVTDNGGSLTVDGTVNVGNEVSINDGGNSITVDGSVSATVSGTVSVDNFPATQTVDGNVGVTGDVNVTQGTDPWVVSGNVNATISGSIGEISFPTTQSDAFGRLRVSNPVTLFDSQNRYVDGEQFSSDNSGNGSVTYNPNSSNFTLSVSGNGDEVIRQAKRVTLYQPGKSLLILNTFAFNTPTANLRQRVGYFTVQNGIFLEADGTDIYIVKRSYTSGSAVDTRIAQSSWNGDTFDGAGASGITLDVSKTQILWTDVEWLGVGSVRVGFVINGVFYIAHTFHHANILTDVYMTTASLNCRYEITSTGGSGSMKQICSTVISEGGYAPTPPNNSVGNGTVEKRLSASNTLYPLCSIRLDPNTPDAVVVPAQFDFITTDVRYGELQLLEGATLTGASWNNSQSSVVETDTSATALSGGTKVFTALFSSRSVVEFTEAIRRRLQLAREADGTPIILTFAAASTGTNTDCLYKLAWEELSN
jgi:hypothetical protein